MFYLFDKQILRLDLWTFFSFEVIWKQNYQIVLKFWSSSKFPFNPLQSTFPLNLPFQDTIFTYTALHMFTIWAGAHSAPSPGTDYQIYCQFRQPNPLIKPSLAGIDFSARWTLHRPRKPPQKTKRKVNLPSLNRSNARGNRRKKNSRKLALSERRRVLPQQIFKIDKLSASLKKGRLAGRKRTENLGVRWTWARDKTNQLWTNRWRWDGHKFCKSRRRPVKRLVSPVESFARLLTAKGPDRVFCWYKWDAFQCEYIWISI